MARNVYVNEAVAARRRVYFQLVDATDGMTPELGEAGGQPQVSLDGASWSAGAIGTLSAIGNGRYYADLTLAAVDTVGRVIETRYKSANTAECPGDTLVVGPPSLSGAGAIAFTYTLINSIDSLPIDGAEVWVTTDLAGSNVVAGPQNTDSFGVVRFYLDAGTYYFWRRKAGWTGANPDVEIVS